MEIEVLSSGSKAGNCYKVSDGDSALLLDAGIKWADIQKKLGFNTHQIDAILVTHEHQDHCKGVKKALMYGKDVYMSGGTADSLGLKHHGLTRINLAKTYIIAGWQMIPFTVEHDAAEPLAFVLDKGAERLLYVTDTEYIKYTIAGLTHVIIECNYNEQIIKANAENKVIENDYLRRVIGSHMSLDTVVGFFEANDLSCLKEVWLTHLSDKNSDAEYCRERIQSLTKAKVMIA